MASATLRRLDTVERVKKELAEVLAEIEAPKSFACGGPTVENLSPGLFLSDHGIVGLPLSKNDADVIISKARLSPFGKGEETLVDTSVRKSWQLEPTQFSIRNSEWNNAINRILNDVYKGLSLNCGRENVSADLYKLLLYEEGAFFKPHRDSEKAPGMFGTLMICLPSSHQGGELVLTHNNDTVEFNTSPTSEFDISYAAWYSDVLHEVKPVTQGYRLVLIYNLIRHNSATVSVPPSPTEYKEKVVPILKQWYLDVDAPKSPDFLVYALEHQYTQASLRLELLKGSDLGIVQCLKDAAAELGFSLYLASTEREVRIDPFSEDEIDRGTVMQHVVTLDGVRVNGTGAYDTISMSDEQVINFDEDQIPDEEDHIEHTGNEGAVSLYWYRDTVVVIVPPSKKDEFLLECDDSMEKILSRLQDLRQDQCMLDDSAILDFLEYAWTVLEYKENRGRPYTFGEQEKAMWARVLQEIISGALDGLDMDLFDQAVRKTYDGMSMEIFKRMGLALAEDQEARCFLEPSISRALKAGFSLRDRQEAWQAVKEGFFRCPEPPEGDENEMARLIRLFDNHWVDTVIGDAHSHYRTLIKADGESIGRIARLLDKSYIEFRMIGIVFSVPIACKIGFCNELLAPTEPWNYPGYWLNRYPNGALPQQPQTTLETRLELVRERLLERIWHDFERNPALINYRPTNRQPTVTPTTRSWTGYDPQSPSARILNGNDLRQLIINSRLAGILTEGDALDCLSTALRAGNRETCIHTLLPFVDEIITSGFLNERDPISGEVRTDIRRLVNDLMLYYLQTCVGNEPPGTVTWSQHYNLGCGCEDCNAVQAFLRNPTRRFTTISCSRPRRRQHLQNQFNKRHITSYKTVTERDQWKIIKKNELFERKTVWERDRDEARTKIAHLNRASLLKDYLLGQESTEAILSANYDRAQRAHIKYQRAQAETAAQTAPSSASAAPAASPAPSTVASAPTSTAMSTPAQRNPPQPTVNKTLNITPASAASAAAPVLASASASTSPAASTPNQRNPLQTAVTNTLNTTPVATPSKRAADPGSGAQAQPKKVKTEPIEVVDLTGV
ncbi:hypothetical protein KCU88_g6480, partial [Aureobasidium melanogenum]